MCQGQGRNRKNQRESNRVCFKAVCVIESWSSCACLTHWLTHTHSCTESAGLTYQRCPTPYIPLHYPPLPFPSPPLLFFVRALFYLFSIFLLHHSVFISHTPSPAPTDYQSLWAQNHPTSYEPCLEMNTPEEEEEKKKIINDSSR